MVGLGRGLFAYASALSLSVAVGVAPAEASAAMTVTDSGDVDGVGVRASTTWRADGDVELRADWAAWLNRLGMDRAALDQSGHTLSDGIEAKSGSTVTLPGFTPGDSEISYSVETSRFSAVPVFEYDAGAIESGLSEDVAVTLAGELELFVWQGRSSDDETAVLAFFNDEDLGWILGSGVTNDPQGGVRNVRYEDGAAQLRIVNEGIAVDREERAGVLSEGNSLGLARPTPQVVNPGSVSIDVMAVGINEPAGDRVRVQDVAPKAASGVAAFNLAMDDSSSSNWVTSGVHAVLRGVMIIDVSGTSHDRSHNLDYLTDSAYGVTSVANAIGVDVVAGYRQDLAGGCGSSRRSPRIVVWQSHNSGCQDDESVTFAHEIVHLFSSVDEHQYSYCDDFVPAEREPVPVGNHYECTPSTVRHTLMGYTHDSARILQLSNPDHYFGGVLNPTGSSTHNNTRLVAENVGAVSNFRTYQASGGGRYTPLETPVRVLDTRDGTGGHANPQGFTVREYSVLAPGVPSSASRVAVNVTVVNPASNGSLRIAQSKTIAESGTTPSIVRFRAGDTRAQTVVIRLSATRTIWMDAASGSSDVVFDVVGYFGNNGGYLHELATPVRVLDEPVSGNVDKTVSLAALSACPSDTLAAAVNIVAAGASQAGHISVRGYYNGVPSTSSVNYSAGEAIANHTFVEIDSRRFKVRPSSTVRIIVDVFGCFRTSSSGGKQLTLYSTPVNRGTVSLTNSAPQTDRYVGGGSGSVALTVADVTANTATSHLTAYRPTSALPSTSNINLAVGDGISNTMTTPTSGSSAEIRIRRNTNTTGTTTVAVIQLGYFK